ncbi:type II toxin-antitoxin system VapB family antitoxin, partial [Arthrospira platensis SPKY1]|nr:type II toxin-antitoxin system VapB family antitoxin [Arthrospira platensis SPKY1]
MPKTAKIFMNGRSQAVRLPAEFRFDCKEVFIEREGDRVVLRPKTQNLRNSLLEFFDKTEPFPDDFLADRE